MGAQPSPGSTELLAAEAPAATSDDREHAVEPGDERVEVVTNRGLEALLVVVPLTLAVVIALGIVIGRFSIDDDPMYLTGLLTVLAAFVVYHGFARRIPDSFERLRARDVVGAGDQATFMDFIHGMTRWLNHPAGLVPGMLFVVFALARFPVAAGGLDGFLGSGSRSLAAGGPMLLLVMLAEAILGFALGLILWRMFVVAWKVSELGDRFSLRLQVNHPDQCGGFRPLGDLCLWNALLVTVPAIYLGIWIVLAPTVENASGVLLYGDEYVQLHGVFLLILAVLAPITFLAPLWSVHEEMLREGARLRIEVDQVGQQIDRLSRDLLERSEQMSTDEAAAAAHDLEIRQENYKRIEQIPEWPIDVGLGLKFGTSQIIPLLGLTGMSQPIIDAIDRFGSFVTPS